LTLAHSRPHLFRAILEGISFGIQHHVEVLASIGARPAEVVAVGGGTRSPLWLQIVSDVTGLPQRVPAVTIGAAYGDAFLAALGVGLVRSAAAIRDWVRDARTVVPNPAHSARYQPYYALYRALYHQNKDLMHTIWELADQGDVA
jgi:xylulokinase